MADEQISGYELTRRFFDFAFENPQCKVQHIALFSWIVELNNRLGWKRQFGLPSNDTMEGLSIGNKGTYRKSLDDLQAWGFIRIISIAKNQFQSSIIEICRFNNEPAVHSALDQAVYRQCTGTAPSSGLISVPIDKQRNKEIKKQRNNIEREGGDHSIANNSRKFQKPEHLEVSDYFRDYTKSNYDPDRFANQFIDHYESKGWKIGKEGMKDWKAAVRTWVNRDPDKYKTLENPKVLRVLKAYDEATGKHFDIEIPNRKVIV